MPEQQPNIKTHLKGPAFNHLGRCQHKYFNINAAIPQDLGRLLDHTPGITTLNVQKTPTDYLKSRPAAASAVSVTQMRNRKVVIDYG